MPLTSLEDFIDDPSDFESKSFQDLDEHLRCHICKEFFDTTMILTTCSHSFCALCIRRSLNTEQNCPRCRTVAHEQNLIHNYDLDNAVSTWRTSRPFLLKADKSVHAPEPIYIPEPVYTLDPVSIPEPMYMTESVYVPETVKPAIIDPLIIDDDDYSKDFVPTPVKHTSSSRIPLTRRSNRLNSQPAPILELKTQKRTQHQQKNNNSQQEFSNNVVDDVLTGLTIVECPICCQSMKYSVLNLHVDRCSNGDSRIPPSSPTQASSSRSTSNTYTKPIEKPMMKVPLALKAQAPINLGKKPNKVVYAMLSDKEIKTILKDLNLPDHGDKAQRVWRHKEYITLYNANYDSERPVCASVLVQRLAAIEKSQAYDRLKRKITDPNEHREKYKSEFDLLIETTRRRKLNKGKELGTAD